MEVVQLDAEGIAALQVVDEVGVGLVGLGGVRLRQVDEVGAVGEDVLALCIGVFGGGGVESVAGGGIEGRRGPFALRFEEECESIAADLYSIGDGILNAYA